MPNFVIEKQLSCQETTGLENRAAVLTGTSARSLVKRQVSNNLLFLLVILVASGLLLRFAPFLRFAEIDTF